MLLKGLKGLKGRYSVSKAWVGC